MSGDTRIVPTGCCHDCGGRCLLKAHVRDGAIVRIETDDAREPQYRACARGRAYRQRVYHSERLKHPLKRVGERGEGKFERVSWDEALDIVANQLQRVKETYGPSATLFWGGTGAQGQIHGRERIEELFLHFGGYTNCWGTASFEGSLYASMASYGTPDTGDTRDNLLHSKLIVLWGCNPAGSVWSTDTALYLTKAKESGIPIVVVDPMYSDTAAALGSEWLPIRPGTDAAALIALAYVIVGENSHDQAFLDRYATGFPQYRDYLLGHEDGIAKSPAWAEQITGIPAPALERLARQYASAKPAALIAGWSAGRTALGEQYHRAAIALAALTGNVGIQGGNAAGFEYVVPKQTRPGPKKPRNPVEAGSLPRPFSLHQLRGGANPSNARIHHLKVYDAILQGKAGGHPADLKLLYVVALNPLNSRFNLNKGIAALRKLEFIVVHDQFLTPTARFADVVLPVNTFMERNDIALPWLGTDYYIFLNKAIDALHESKSDHEIAIELAKRLNVPSYPIRTEEQLIEEFIASRTDIDEEGYRTLRREGVLKIRRERPTISFEKNIADPDNHPFPTPSGKIELYSELLAQMNDASMPPIPKYIPTWESLADPLAAQHPLQLITLHAKTHTHSTLEKVPWLRELDPRRLVISVTDAAARGIADGDLVQVFNERGSTSLPAKVTERIMPGVIALAEGAYFTPDGMGIDHAGCSNILLNDRHSPGGAWPTNTTLVQVSRQAENA